MWQPGPDDHYEIEEIVQAILQHVLHHRQINIAIAVNEDIPKAHRVAEGSSLRFFEPISADEQVEELSVGARLSQAFVGGYMRGHVLGSLDGDLQRVFDESFLTDVGVDQLGPFPAFFRKNLHLGENRDKTREWVRRVMAYDRP